jgi:hypothetical protein
MILDWIGAVSVGESLIRLRQPPGKWLGWSTATPRFVHHQPE